MSSGEKKGEKKKVCGEAVFLWLGKQKKHDKDLVS